jgi:hypothetical protein
MRFLEKNVASFASQLKAAIHLQGKSLHCAHLYISETFAILEQSGCP